MNKEKVRSWRDPLRGARLSI